MARAWSHCRELGARNPQRGCQRVEIQGRAVQGEPMWRSDAWVRARVEPRQKLPQSQTIGLRHAKQPGSQEFVVRASRHERQAGMQHARARRGLYTRVDDGLQQFRRDAFLLRADRSLCGAGQQLADVTRDAAGRTHDGADHRAAGGDARRLPERQLPFEAGEEATKGLAPQTAPDQWSTAYPRDGQCRSEPNFARDHPSKRLDVHSRHARTRVARCRPWPFRCSQRVSSLRRTAFSRPRPGTSTRPIQGSSGR